MSYEVPTPKDAAVWADAAIARHGPWFVMLVVLLIAAWRVASWFGPKADMLIDTHITTVKALSTDVSTMKGKIDDIHRTVVPEKFGSVIPQKKDQRDNATEN